MARLAAIEKSLYYPTPMRVIGMLTRVLDNAMTFTPGGALLDPCAGEGHAACFLARWFDLVSYGVELDANRAKVASEILDHAKCGSYHQIQVPDASISLLFLNPPYDEDAAADDGSAQRQEVVFLQAMFNCLVSKGVLVYVVPRRLLKKPSLQDCLRENFSEIKIWKFPEPEIAAFDQVVLVARRYRQSVYWYYGDVSSLNADDFPVLGEDPYVVSNGQVLGGGLDFFKLKKENPEEFAPSDEGGVFSSARWKLLTSEVDRRSFAPLVAPRPGHQAMLLAAGHLNGVEINSQIVRGGSVKTIKTIKQETQEIEREQIESHLSFLSLETGEVETWTVNTEQEKTAAWFRENREVLANAILDGHTPLFNGDLSKFDFGDLQAPGVLPGRNHPELLPIQKESSAAIVHLWRSGEKTAFLCGEQGTGKTTMAIVAASMAKLQKVIVICPTHLIAKWVRECGTITGNPRIARTAKRVSDVDAFFEDDHAQFLILTKEMAKLGTRWEAAYAQRKVRVTREVRTPQGSWEEAPVQKQKVSLITCPSCGAFQKIKDGQGYLSPSESLNKTRLTCQGCKSPLWTSVALNAKGTKRWPLARYINKKFARRYSLVLDECHQFKGSESDQGLAMHWMAVGAKKVLAMTGTLYGGYASSIFHLLYRNNSHFRQQYDHDACAMFVKHHGLFETVFKTEEHTSIYNYRKGHTGRLKEIPGMNPAMINVLLPFCVFVKLKDLQIELPPYSEEVEIINHHPDVTKAAKSLASEVQLVLRKYPTILGQYLMACLGYPDRPDQEEKIVYHNPETGGDELIASAPAFPNQVWPKDQRVIDLCLEEHEKGRRTLVFFSQTQRRDARGRVRKALEDQGLRVITLDASVSPEKREAWLREQESKGFDVMLTNGRLVETGMDLLFANTIIQFGIEYSISSLRQSIRRSWRLGQVHPVRVIFLAYAETMQEAAIDLIARKMRAAQMVDGDETEGLAQFDVGGANLLIELAHEVISSSKKRIIIEERVLTTRTAQLELGT